MIERDKERHFILTGSSARRLKRGSANLLAGRALIAHIHPLVSAEIGSDRLEDRLFRGSLPPVIDSAIPLKDLQAYVGHYLREEVQAEALTRSIEGFSRFLEVAASANGELVNSTSIGNDAAVPPRTIAVEVKAKERIAEGEFRGLRALAEEFPLMRRIVASGEKWRRITADGIEIIPIGEFLDELWRDSLLSPIEALQSAPKGK